MYCPTGHEALQLAHCLSNWVVPVQKPTMYSPEGGLARYDWHLPLHLLHWLLPLVGLLLFANVHSSEMNCPFSPAE